MIQLLPVAETDLPAWVALHAAAFLEDHNRYGAGPPGFEDLEWHRNHAAQHRYLWIERDGQFVGGIVVEEKGPAQLYLGVLFIDPTCHNQGLGQAAVEALERAYSHIRHWSLHTPYTNFRNHHFYEKLGYVKTDEIPFDELPGLEKGFRLFVYEKHLVR